MTTDVFLTHDWGVDKEGRDNHARVAYINDLLKKGGITTWFDSEKMTGRSYYNVFIQLFVQLFATMQNFDSIPFEPQNHRFQSVSYHV